MNKTYISEFNQRSNNLGLIKWIAAILVIFSHSFSVAGQGVDYLDRLSGGEISFGGFAVAIFFFASGFFVTKSLLRKNDAKAYVVGRISRIYPALIFVLFCTVFILGPIVSTLPASEYFKSTETYMYLLYLFMIPRYTLPGVFLDNPVSGIVNGPLWTLLLEAICYIGLLVVWKLGLIKNRRLMRVCGVLLLVLGIAVFGIKIPLIYGYHLYLRPFILFVIGMLFCVFEDKICLDIRFFIIAVIMSAIFAVSGYFDLAMIFCFPYILSCVVFGRYQVPDRIGNLGNYSYFMYLVAYPIQQAFVFYNPDMSVGCICVLASVISFVISIPGYHVIEKKGASLLSVKTDKA